MELTALEARPVQLKKKFLETGPNAAANWVQIGHRRTAVEYALAGIKRVHDANLEKLGRDPFNSEMEGRMQAWVAETLLQGAYIREFHLWEKDCKAYFAANGQRNASKLEIVPKKGQPIMAFVRKTLALFSVTVPPTVLDVIGKMNKRVNIMKHNAGLKLDHFITEQDYGDAIKALESFWLVLNEAEKVEP